MAGRIPRGANGRAGARPRRAEGPSSVSRATRAVWRKTGSSPGSGRSWHVFLRVFLRTHEPVDAAWRTGRGGNRVSTGTTRSPTTRRCPSSTVGGCRSRCRRIAIIRMFFKYMKCGEPDRNRTCDQLIKSQLLYQLSYGPGNAGKLRSEVAAVKGAFRRLAKTALSGAAGADRIYARPCTGSDKLAGTCNS